MTADVEIDISFGDLRAIPFAVTSASVPSNLQAAAQAAGGTFAAGTYFWVVTFIDASGETPRSNEASAVIILNGSCNLTWNAPPAGVTGVRVYRGTVAGTENVLVATLGPVAAYTDTGIAGSAGTPPAANSTAYGNVQVLQGESTFYGWSFHETSGTGPAVLALRNGGTLLALGSAAAGGTFSFDISSRGIHPVNQLVIQA